jgi:type IV pilus assembly protein PilW
MRKKTSGFTLIEMLVGIVIGMIVVAAASVMMVTVLKTQKDVTASARLNQELGAAMAVMSNEIRRAGFRVCDADVFDCPDIDDDEEEDSFILSYALGKDVNIGTNTTAGDCILYRYNANVDKNGSVSGTNDYFGEHRGFRLIDNSDGIGVIQIADDNYDTDIKCDGGDLNDRWITLTNPDVIDITGLSFTTAGSKCRNMDESKNWYWQVVSVNETELACELVDSIALPSCTPLTTGVSTCVSPLMETDDDIFATHQVTIRVEAELSRDSTVTKVLNSSVKVANPWVGKF